MENTMKIILEVLPQKTSKTLGLVKSCVSYSAADTSRAFDRNECQYLERGQNKADFYTNVMKFALDSIKLKHAVLETGEMTSYHWQFVCCQFKRF